MSTQPLATLHVTNVRYRGSRRRSRWTTSGGITQGNRYDEAVQREIDVREGFASLLIICTYAI